MPRRKPAATAAAGPRGRLGSALSWVPPTFILQLFGFPAAGKLTVAQEIARLVAERGEDVLVLDNHHINNVLFPIVQIGDGVDLSPRLVEHVLAVRDRVLAVVEELAPPQRSFIFTNVLIEDPEDIDRNALEEMARLAERTGRGFLAVRLTCDVEVLAARIGAPDRQARMKWLDADGVRRFARSATLLQVQCLELDTTAAAPNEVARVIVGELNRLREEPGPENAA